jgi:hypothetical protein
MASLEDKIFKVLLAMETGNRKKVLDLPCQIYEELYLLKRTTGNHFFKWLVNYVFRFHQMPTGAELIAFTESRSYETEDWMTDPEAVDRILSADNFQVIEFCRRYTSRAPCPRHAIRGIRNMLNASIWGFL